MSTDPNRLLVPVANPETADRLVNTAVDVARDRALEILVVHVVEVPMQLSLQHAKEGLDVDDRTAVVDYALEIAREAGVPASGRVRFGRDVATSILHVAETESVEATVLGWRGRPRRRDIVLGGYIDEILSNAPCDVLVERIDRDGGEISSVLVPVAGGPNTEFAVEISGALARAHDATVELVTVVPDREQAMLEDGRDLLVRSAANVGAVQSVEETVLVGGDVADTIVERTRDHDVTVIGAAERGALRRALVGDVPETVGREADGAVIVAKRHQGVTEALWRRLRDLLQ